MPNFVNFEKKIFKVMISQGKKYVNSCSCLATKELNPKQAGAERLVPATPPM